MGELEHELAWLLDDEVFSVDGEPFSWRDVLAAAELRGAVAAAIEATRQGLAGVAASEPSPEAVRDAAARFRYDRGLLAADELESWLARWRLSVADWTAHLARSLRAGAQDTAAPPEELGNAAAVDAICGGLLEREATRLATDAALAGLDTAGASDRLERIAAAAGAARAELAASADVEREIASRTLEWTRIDTEQLELADPDAAREAALCVRVDGRSLAEVAADCGVPATRRELYLEDAERERLPALLGANAGELVGPIERDGGFLLVQVHSRIRPSADDPALRRRAEADLVERAAERARETRVRWS
jgi:hypothetical protein